MAEFCPKKTLFALRDSAALSMVRSVLHEKGRGRIGLKTLPYHKSQEREFLTGFYSTIGGRRSTKKYLSRSGLLHFLYYAGALCSIHHGHNRVHFKVSPCGDL